MPADSDAADSAAVPGPRRRRGPRPRHTREQVIEAAIAIADADGLEAVTIRAVAARLQAGAMSLYSYVPDKQALVYAMVEQVSEELELPPEPSGDWRADVRWFTRQQRAIVHRHPWLIAALSHRQPLGPATLAYLEFMLAALEPAWSRAPSWRRSRCSTASSSTWPAPSWWSAMPSTRRRPRLTGPGWGNCWPAAAIRASPRPSPRAGRRAPSWRPNSTGCWTGSSTG